MQYESFSSTYDIITLPWQAPLTLADRIKALGHMIWMDSTAEYAVDQEQSYDIITACPEVMVYATGNALTQYDLKTNQKKHWNEDPFNYLETLVDQYAIDLSNDEALFTGGLAGYWGYELNHVNEPKSVRHRDSHWPDMAVGLYLWSLVVNHSQQTLTLFFHPKIADEKKKKIVDLVTSAERFNSPSADNSMTLKTPFNKQMPFEYYQHAFKKIKEYIYAGDCYQVNLTQRFSAEYQGDLWEAYKQLRMKSPTPFAAFFDCGPITILSHSPERFIKLYQGNVETKPIKGTQPRYKCPAKDEHSAKTLMSSEKDRAENLMIVDLVRNDLSRHCEANSVKTTQLFSLESYANVHHLVSLVEGKLKKETTPIRLLRDAFPGGSITGAPKIRAMQIIRELEPVARSVYCGAIGYISLNGNMDTNIPIRTLVADDHQISCWGGGGIVADSICEHEYQESKIKVNNLTTFLESIYLKDYL